MEVSGEKTERLKTAKREVVTALRRDAASLDFSAQADATRGLKRKADLIGKA